MGPKGSTACIYPKRNEKRNKYMYKLVHSNTSHASQQGQTAHWPSTGEWISQTRHIRMAEGYS